MLQRDKCNGAKMRKSFQHVRGLRFHTVVASSLDEFVAELECT